MSHDHDAAVQAAQSQPPRSVPPSQNDPSQNDLSQNDLSQNDLSVGAGVQGSAGKNAGDKRAEAPRPEDLEMRPRGKDARGRLFRNRVMENLTRVSPTVALCTYIPIALAFVVVNFWQGFEPNVWIAAALFLGGMLSWTFFEYIVHRFVFHFITESKVIKTFHYYAHGIHHEFPRDHGRLFMPPAIAITVSAFVFGLFWLIMGVRSFMFFPGFVIGYLLYAFLHYSIHRFRPPKMFKFLWRHHLQHHYRCPKRAFGVSSPFWDFIFRTLPPSNSEEDSLSRLPQSRTEQSERARKTEHSKTSEPG